MDIVKKAYLLLADGARTLFREVPQSATRKDRASVRSYSSTGMGYQEVLTDPSLPRSGRYRSVPTLVNNYGISFDDYESRKELGFRLSCADIANTRQLARAKGNARRGTSRRRRLSVWPALIPPSDPQAARHEGVMNGVITHRGL